MLRLRPDMQLIWDEEDVVAMAKVMGGQYAAKQKSPYHPAIVKLAAKRGVLLNHAATDQLNFELFQRQEAKALRDLPDTQGDPSLWKHQRVDSMFLEKMELPAYLLAEEASVGKTFPAIDWVAKRGTRHLVICPGEVKEQWRDAIWERCGPSPIQIVEGTIAEQIKQITSMRRGWVITHWESLVHARIGLLQRPWDTVTADEAHLAQNRKALRSETLFELSKLSRYRIALSGNPFAGDATEMFSILKFLYPALYTSFWRWAMMHMVVVPGPFDNMMFDGVKRPKLLRWEIGAFTIRRTVQQVRPNMPLTAQRRRVAVLTPRGLREYKKLQKELFAELDGLGDDTKTIPLFNGLARTMRLRQYVIDPGLIGAREPSLKYPMVWELMRELNSPLVIFSQYTAALFRLMEYLKQQNKKIKRGLIIGRKHKHPATHNAKQRFLAGDIDILGVSGKKGGLGLNLGKYGLVSMLDLPWRSRDFTQWIRRVDRPEEGTGRVVPTTNYRFIVRDTYEVKMEKLLQDTHHRFGEVFSVGQLRDLFG